MNEYEKALEFLVQYAEAFVMVNERDIDYRNSGLQEIKNAKEILKSCKPLDWSEDENK